MHGKRFGVSHAAGHVIDARGDVLRIETGGGGGRGHPFDREPEAVLQDVLEGYVSIEAAQSQYGVIIREQHIDAAATAQLRTNRPASRAFHRKAYVDALV